MHNFLEMVWLAPVLFGACWVYTSRLQPLNGNTAMKVAVRAASLIVFFGGFFAPLFFLRNHEPPDTRRLYLEAWVYLVSIPGLVIMVCRRHNGNNGNKVNGEHH